MAWLWLKLLLQTPQHVNRKSNLLIVHALHNPGPDPRAQHRELKIRQECAKLGPVDFGETHVEVGLLLSDYVDILTDKSREELVHPDLRYVGVADSIQIDV